MRLALLLTGAIVGLTVALIQYRKQCGMGALYEEARLNRLRILNQDGDRGV